MGDFIKRRVCVVLFLVLMLGSLGLVLAQDNEEIELVSGSSLRFRGFDTGSLIIMTILLFFTIIGIILLSYSKRIESKSLKISIILPLLFWILGIIYWIGDLFYVLDLGAYGMYFFLFAPIILVAVGFSIFALVKIRVKRIPILNLILNIVYLLIWIFFVSSARMG